MVGLASVNYSQCFISPRVQPLRCCRPNGFDEWVSSYPLFARVFSFAENILDTDVTSG